MIDLQGMKHTVQLWNLPDTIWPCYQPEKIMVKKKNGAIAYVG